MSLARTVAELRTQERCYVAAESLVALAALKQRGLAAATRADRERAEWFWAMLSDHAWNGTNPENKRHNAKLRQRWADGLGAISRGLTRQAWEGLGLQKDERFITVFNPLGFNNDVLVVCDAPPWALGITGSGKVVPAQFDEGQEARRVTFVAKGVPAFGFREFVFIRKAPPPTSIPFQANPRGVAGPFWRG